MCTGLTCKLLTCLPREDGYRIGVAEPFLQSSRKWDTLVNGLSGKSDKRAWCPEGAHHIRAIAMAFIYWRGGEVNHRGYITSVKVLWLVWVLNGCSRVEEKHRRWKRAGARETLSDLEVWFTRIFERLLCTIFAWIEAQPQLNQKLVSNF